MPNQPDIDLLKIGEFARLAGTNLRTLRYYEELGLLEPSARSQGGFRYYRRTDVNRLTMIQDMKNLGLNLDRIREVIATRGKGGQAAFLKRVRAALAEQDRLLLERLANLEGQRRKIHEAMEKIGQCRTCEHTPGAHNNFCEPCAMTGEPLPKIISALY